MTAAQNVTNALEVTDGIMAGWGLPVPSKKVTLPSGAVVRLVQLDVPKMIELDILDKMDSFTGKVLEDPSKKKKKAKEAESDTLDPEKLAGLLEVLDKITVACVVEPVLAHLPEPNDDGEIVEEEGVRYVKYVPLADKMKIFETAGEGLGEFFRLGGEQAADLGTVPAIEGSAQVTE